MRGASQRFARGSDAGSSRENSYTPSPGASTTADWADWISATSNAKPARRAACFSSSQLSSIGRFGEIDRVLSEAGSDGRTISTSSYCPISARSGGTTSSSTASTSSTAVSCEAKGLAYKFARFWALPLVGKRCPGPRSSLLDALTGLLAELEAFLARRIGVVQLLERDEEPAQRPPEAPDGTCRVSVVLSDVGFRLCHGTSSRLHRKHPARVRSLLGDPGATPRDAVGRSWVQSRASTARGSRRPWRSHSSGPATRV